MDAKEILKGIKALFNAPVVPVAPAVPAVAPVAPVQAAEPIATGTPFKLKDGSEISITMVDPAGPSVGDSVTVMGAPAPAADYELEDGSIITVGATGAIEVVVAPAPATQPDFEQPVMSLEDRIKALEVKLLTPAMPSGYEAQQIAFSAMTEEVAKHKETIKQLFDLCELLTKEPSAAPATLTGNKKEQFERRQAKEASTNKYAEALSKVTVIN